LAGQPLAGGAAMPSDDEEETEDVQPYGEAEEAYEVRAFLPLFSGQAPFSTLASSSMRHPSPDLTTLPSAPSMVTPTRRLRKRRSCPSKWPPH
jgi:hypothetical protein